MSQPFAFPDPDSALKALAEQLSTVNEVESIALGSGRILAQAVSADRDSPAADVSAMDGYAIRLKDLQEQSDLPISGESSAGAAPPEMTDGQVVRIFTGAIVPQGCQAVIKREDTRESDQSIRLLPAAIESTRLGSNIRRGGENAQAGSEVLAAGSMISDAAVATLANFGVAQPTVYRRVKVSVLTTGDEVMDVASKTLQPWQLRNSNRAVCQAMLDRHPFVEVHRCEHVIDDPQALHSALADALDDSDAVIFTGGVSKGDYDYVPDTITDLGGRIVFHGLPIRPGKPLLGAATESGKLVLGLPGNPVSSCVNCRRFAVPLLRKLGGCGDWADRPARATLRQPPAKPIPLHGMLLARCFHDGTAELVLAKGSGDLVALGHSDGFICLPPNEQSTGPWPMFQW